MSGVPTAAMRRLRKWLSKSERRSRCSNGTASRCSMPPKSRSKKYRVGFSTAWASSGACAPDIPEVRGIVRGMLADQWCQTSWRAQPGSFVSLMTLYESNFVRLGWLVRGLRSIVARAVSHVGSDCDLFLTPIESCPYTSVFRLTYEFDFEGEWVRDPDLEVCVYHDARLAEVRSFYGFKRHPELVRLESGLKRELDQRWSRNMLLNKWLEYCA